VELLVVKLGPFDVPGYHVGECCALLAQLPEKCVDLVLSDLPSGETEAPFDKPIHLPSFWTAVSRALKPHGCVVLMASSLRFAAEVMGSNPAWYRYDLIWSKSMVTGFLNAGHRPLRAHEFVLVFAPSGHSTYNAQMSPGQSPIHPAGRTRSHGQNYGAMTYPTFARAGATDRYPISVLRFASVGTTDGDRIHPQQKPESLISWLLRTYSNPGDLVVDTCAGSGVVGRVAEDEGRRWLLFDLQPEHAEAAAQKTAQTGLLTRLPAGPQRPSTTVLDEVDAGACGGEGADQGGTPALLDRAQSVTEPTHVEVRGAETRTSAAGRSRTISVIDVDGRPLLP
jgi:site-specific DNA-methyltransferase (adenine-specific)